MTPTIKILGGSDTLVINGAHLRLATKGKSEVLRGTKHGDTKFDDDWYDGKHIAVIRAVGLLEMAVNQLRGETPYNDDLTTKLQSLWLEMVDFEDHHRAMFKVAGLTELSNDEITYET